MRGPMACTELRNVGTDRLPDPVTLGPLAVESWIDGRNVVEQRTRVGTASQS